MTKLFTVSVSDEVARSKWSEVDSTDADSTVQMSTNDERSSMSEDESIDIDPKIQEPAGSVVSTVSTVSAWGKSIRMEFD